MTEGEQGVSTEKPYIFTASKDHVDSLKMDASILEPQEEVSLQKSIKEINELFVNRYAEFIPSWKIQEGQTIQDRVLVTSPKSYELMWNEWDSASREDAPDLKAHERPGVFFEEGQLVVINPAATDKWESDFYPQNVKDMLIAKAGNEEAARKLAIDEFQTNLLAHEIVHSYQDLNLKEYTMFLEAAVRYYHMEIATQLHKDTINEGWEDKYDVKFKFFLHIYGDDIHKLFFGSKMDGSKKREILTHLSQRTFAPYGLSLTHIFLLC